MSTYHIIVVLLFCVYVSFHSSIVVLELSNLPQNNQWIKRYFFLLAFILTISII